MGLDLEDTFSDTQWTDVGFGLSYTPNFMYVNLKVMG